MNWSSRRIRPKSSATVVVDLPATALVSSTPRDTSVMSASVASGSMSEMAPTNVVLPTPNPPLTTILTAVVGGIRSERSYTVPDPLEHGDGDLVGLRPAGQATGEQVRDEYLGDPEGHAQTDRDLGDGMRGLAQLHDGAQLEAQRR